MKVIDLFAGAGGLSLGTARAGFNVVASVEIDTFAVESHKENFPKARHIQQSVASLSGKELLKLANVRQGELDGLIGGPPCQGFSTMGKRQVDDPRNDLFLHFFRLVKETSPAFFVAENVPGILNEQYDEIRESAFSLVRKEYVLLKPIKVKASDFGAPTTRTRIFFIGYDPRRFRSEIRAESFNPTSKVKLINVRDALTNLPTDIDPNGASESAGWRFVKNEYRRSHFFNRISGLIPRGVGNNNAMERFFEHGQVSGCIGTLHSSEVEARFQALAHGEQDVISRAIRLDPNGFCPTLRAGTASDRGSFQAVRPIHSECPRVITPREAARLQGFPDWFIFHPTKWHSFRQIGNSVSPIVAEHILKVIHDAI